MKTKGYYLIESGSVYNLQIADSAGILETKLALDHSTQYLYDDMVSKTRDTVIAEGTKVTIPASGIYYKDAESGQTWLATIHNGVMRFDIV